LEAAAGGIACDTSSIDAAADDENIDAVFERHVKTSADAAMDLRAKRGRIANRAASPSGAQVQKKRGRLERRPLLCKYLPLRLGARLEGHLEVAAERSAEPGVVRQILARERRLIVQQVVDRERHRGLPRQLHPIGQVEVQVLLDSLAGEDPIVLAGAEPD